MCRVSLSSVEVRRERERKPLSSIFRREGYREGYTIINNLPYTLQLTPKGIEELSDQGGNKRV